MTEKELPSVKDIDPKDPLYLNRLEAGFMMFSSLESEIFEKSFNLRKSLLKEHLEKAESFGLAEKVQDIERKLEVEGKFELNEESFGYALKPTDDPALYLRFISDTLGILAGKMPELKALSQRAEEVSERKKEFLDALLGLSELKPLFEQGEVYNRAILYIVDGANDVYCALVDLVEGKHTPLLESAVSKENLYRRYVVGVHGRLYNEKNTNVFVVSNPSTVLDKEQILRYAAQQLQEKYEQAHPEDIAKIRVNQLLGFLSEALQEQSPSKCDEKQDITNVINSLEKDPLTGIVGKHMYDSMCPECSKKDSCPLYSIFNTKYSGPGPFDLGRRF